MFFKKKDYSDREYVTGELVKQYVFLRQDLENFKTELEETNNLSLYKKFCNIVDSYEDQFNTIITNSEAYKCQ